MSRLETFKIKAFAFKPTYCLPMTLSASVMSKYYFLVVRLLDKQELVATYLVYIQHYKPNIFLKNRVYPDRIQLIFTNFITVVLKKI